MRKLEVGKSESPKESLKSEVKKKSEVGMPNAELENTSAPPTGGPQSEIEKKSEVGSSKSEVKKKSEKESTSAINTSHSEIETLPTANSKLQTATMEVHHHPEVEKKGFKEYILEGLMIFLAVMMGFIAENVRESISEHKRAGEFARSYFEDIKKDTTALHETMRFSRHKIATIDSALLMLHLPVKMRKDTVLYRQLSVSSNVMAFEPSEGTYEQIKSSGSLRYFDQKLVGLMNSYDVQVKKTVKREDIDLKFIVDQVMPFAIKNFNSEVIYDVYFPHRISHEMYYADSSKRTMRQMINYMVVVKIERLRAIAEYARQMKISGEVLVELRKEYDLE